MNTTMISRSDVSSSTANLHGLPFPLNNEDGSGACNPSEENETGS